MRDEKKVLGREKQFVGGLGDLQDDPDQADMMCPNCHEMIPGDQTVAHTVQCYRQSTKCRICGEIIQKSKKKEHLMKWRSIEGLLTALREDDEESSSLYFDHGMDVNM